MYYNSEQIDEELKCSVCLQQLRDVVKLIPDCGELICDFCCEELKASVDESGIYKCQACTKQHTMPQNGFVEIKSLSKIIKLAKTEKPLTSDAKLLKSMIGSLDDRIKKFRSFEEQRDFINDHCDQLELQVMEEIESLRRQVNEMEKDLLKQISEYRETCLDSWSARSANAQSTDITIHSNKIEEELVALSNETADFSAKWAKFFNQIVELASEKEVTTALEEARQFEKKMDSLENMFKIEALNGHSMKLVTEHSLIGGLEALRKIITLTVRDNQAKGCKIQPTPSSTLNGHSGLVNQVLFLPDGKLASCSNDRTIRIWDLENGTMLFKLEGHTDSVYSLALLSNGWLASGSEDKTIKIWNLGERKKMGTLEGHHDSVVSLKTLKYRNLVSYSLDDTIKIWNPFLAENNHLLTIAGHGNTFWDMNFGILSYETLVTCSVEHSVEETSILRLWNPSDGQLIKSVSVNIKFVFAFLVLSNDQAALGSEDGTIKIIDLSEGIEVGSTAQEDDHGSVFWFAQLTNGDLVSSCSKKDGHKINVWSIDGGLKLIQSVTTDYSSPIYSLAISQDETLLVSGSSHGSITLWPIINQISL